ncbi:hypothetical protein RND71_005656 [Anisodus tanguticus]|uniref:Uncharacterized protein n=1 Tax=Anisodus tanguticus TaxID=243964 RepID=A0AAE1VV60_9SOLA|nr:hypothetical protein RND71_005656 [Anisodus tanguticus]
MGVVGVLDTALLCSIHGDTVEKVLFEDDDGANTFRAFNPTQAEETHSMYDGLGGVLQRKCKMIEEFAPPRKILKSTTTTMRDPFSFSSLPGKGDQRKWRTHNILWVHRIKRKAALSWQSFKRKETLGLVGASERNESKTKMDQCSLPAKLIGEGLKDGTCKVDRAHIM